MGWSWLMIRCLLRWDDSGSIHWIWCHVLLERGTVCFWFDWSQQRCKDSFSKIWYDESSEIWGCITSACYIYHAFVPQKIHATEKNDTTGRDLAGSTFGILWCSFLWTSRCGIASMARGAKATKTTIYRLIFVTIDVDSSLIKWRKDNNFYMFSSILPWTKILFFSYWSLRKWFICQASSRGQDSEMLGPIALQQNMEQVCTNQRWGNHSFYPWDQFNPERQDKRWVQEWFRCRAVLDEWQGVSGGDWDVSRCLKCQAWIIQSNERVRLGPWERLFWEFDKIYDKILKELSCFLNIRCSKSI